MGCEQEHGTRIIIIPDCQGLLVMMTHVVTSVGCVVTTSADVEGVDVSSVFANLLTLNSPKTEFLLIGLKKQLDKIHNSSLNRPTSRSRKPLRLADDILRLASRLPGGGLAGGSRLAAAYGLHLKSADKLLSKVTFETCRRRLKTFFSNC